MYYLAAMAKTQVLEKIEKIEKDMKDLRKLIRDEDFTEAEEERKALEAIRIYEKEKKEGRLKLLKDPKELLG